MCDQRFVVGIASALAALISAASTLGQTTSTGSGATFPIRLVRIVTSEPGGGGDFVARLIAQGLAAPLGQQVIVDNRPAGVIPGQIVSQAPPDGHTMLVFGNSIWIGSLLQSTPYDPVRDFAPVTMATRSPNILVVHPSLPVKSVTELVVLAKARPGELNYASGAPGGAPHISGEMFKAMAGINIMSIPFKGSGPSLASLVGGHVQLTFATAASVTPHIKSGRLRALAMSTAQRSALAPGLPTVAETVPGYESVSLFGVWAPAKTPEPVITRLNAEIAKVLTGADARDKLFAVGVEAVASTPVQFADAIKTDIARLSALIRNSGIRIYT